MARSWWATDHACWGVGQPISDHVVAHMTSEGVGALVFMNGLKKHENGY